MPEESTIHDLGELTRRGFEAGDHGAFDAMMRFVGPDPVLEVAPEGWAPSRGWRRGLYAMIYLYERGEANMRTGITLSCLAVAAVLTSCGSSTTKTLTASAAAVTTATRSTATTAATPSTRSSAFSGQDGVPAYQPSTVVSEGPTSLRIISPESVPQVSAYYASTFTGEGWVLVSKSVALVGAGFTVHQNGQEVTVAVYPTASGSGVLISSYRRPPTTLARARSRGPGRAGGHARR